VRSIAEALPGCEEKPSGGGTTWFLRRKPFAWESMPWPSQLDHSRATVASEPCISVNFAEADDNRGLLEGWPDLFVDAKTKWSTIRLIVRLKAGDAEHLTELGTESPQFLQGRSTSRQLDR
jgi:hypothetical protein